MGTPNFSVNSSVELANIVLAAYWEWHSARIKADIALVKFQEALLTERNRTGDRDRSSVSLAKEIQNINGRLVFAPVKF